MPTMPEGLSGEELEEWMEKQQTISEMAAEAGMSAVAMGGNGYDAANEERARLSRELF